MKHKRGQQKIIPPCELTISRIICSHAWLTSSLLRVTATQISKQISTGNYSTNVPYDEIVPENKTSSNLALSNLKYMMFRTKAKNRILYNNFATQQKCARLSILHISVVQPIKNFVFSQGEPHL